MKYHVNETCIGCGLCAATCPAVFTMNDETGIAESITADVPAAMENSAKEAQEGCPAGAIESV